MPELREAFLAGYVRTPFGRADARRGVFRRVRSDDLALVVLGEVLRRAGLAPGDVDGVVLGAVEMMGEQAHPGTAIPFLAGFPPRVTGLSIERACTTATMSIHVAAMQIACALGELYLVGTTALELRRRGARFGLATICGGMGQGAATILEAAV